MRGADQDAGGPGAGRMRAGAAGAGPDARRSRKRAVVGQELINEKKKRDSGL